MFRNRQGEGTATAAVVSRETAGATTATVIVLCGSGLLLMVVMHVMHIHLHRLHLGCDQRCRKQRLQATQRKHKRHHDAEASGQSAHGVQRRGHMFSLCFPEGTYSLRLAWPAKVP